MLGPQFAFFFDIDENGRQDIVYISKQGNKPITIKAIYNNLIQDHFYLKSMFFVSHENKTGASPAIGVSYRCIATDLDDSRSVLVHTQLNSNGYAALSAPQSFFGIGRSNNYVEDVTVAYFNHGKRELRVWTPIIPNS